MVLTNFRKLLYYTCLVKSGGVFGFDRM